MKIKVFTFILFSLLILGSIKMFFISYEYFTIEPNVNFLKTKHFAYKIPIWKWSFYVHVFSSFILLFTGITQFITAFHKRFPKAHRYFGATYLVVLLFASAPSGLVLGWFANGGPAAKASFVIMGFLWWIFSFVAFLKIRNKNWVGHGEFMLRSYALTLSAITLRTFALVLSFIHLNATPTEKYILIAWLSWIPNLLIAEWLIRRGWVSKYLNEFFEKSKL